MRRILLCFSLFLQLGCSRPIPLSGSRAADGVARITFEVRANATDLMPLTVLFPADDTSRPSVSNAPALVYVQGGAVPTQRYEWHAIALAQLGFVVALPEHPNALALFATDNGQAARRTLTNAMDGVLAGLVDGARVGVVGHSLGGVVARKLALDGGFKAVAVLASFTDPADTSRLVGSTVPSLHLTGTTDCFVSLADIRARWAQEPSPTVLMALDGVTHYQFTDSDAEDAQRQCTGAVSLADAHVRILQATAGFFREALAGQKLPVDALRSIPGATVEFK
jgi:predicted dienelactone hydrolase